MEINEMIGDEIVVICHGPDDLVYGPFATIEDADAWFSISPCDNEHDVTRLIKVSDETDEPDETDASAYDPSVSWADALGTDEGAAFYTDES